MLTLHRSRIGEADLWIPQEYQIRRVLHSDSIVTRLELEPTMKLHGTAHDSPHPEPRADKSPQATSATCTHSLFVDRFTLASCDAEQLSSLARQLAFLQGVQHGNLLHIAGVYQTVSGTPEMRRNSESVSTPDHSRTKHLYVMQSELDCSLMEILRSDEVLSITVIQQICLRILRALSFLHAQHVVLRNLTPSNIQVSCRYEAVDSVRVSNFFQLAVEGEMYFVPMTVEAFSPYAAPEQIAPGHRVVASAASDMWALGCIVLEMFTSHALFLAPDHLQQWHRIAELLGHPSQKNHGNAPPHFLEYASRLPLYQPQSLRIVAPRASKAAIDLLQKLLQVHPQQRITAVEALQHPFFTEDFVRYAPSCTSLLPGHTEQQWNGDNTMWKSKPSLKMALSYLHDFVPHIEVDNTVPLG